MFIERPNRHGAIVASALLIGSLMSSGIGLFFVVAVAGRTVVDRVFRPRVLAVVTPAGAYLVWHASMGRDAGGDAGDLADPVSVTRFALRGIGFSVEAMVGLDRLPTSGVAGVVGHSHFCVPSPFDECFEGRP